MPKSRRDKKISLTKTDRKGLSSKQQIIEEIQKCKDEYQNIFLFTVHNMRNSKLKEIRTEWKHSRLFFGKNRVMRLGLKSVDVDESEEGNQNDDLEKLQTEMIGQCGLLFTNKSKDYVVDWFKNYSAQEYARSGFKATKTVSLPAGPLEEFSHAIEPHLRSLGMPTKLERGIVTLYSDFTVCERNKVLTPEQARILKLLGKPMAKFKIVINSCFTKENGFETIQKRHIKVTAKTKKVLNKKKNKQSDDEPMEEDVDIDEEGEESDSDELQEMDLDDDNESEDEDD
uniref:Ribosome assembly factor mrt4 n=1 Tax=Corethrella appendiculata TaxID=1370023 RepID=U5EXG8_9DIPT